MMTAVVEVSDRTARRSRRSLHFRLYTWSIVTDPLLFFVISDQYSTGVNLTLSRILQGAFLATLCVRLAWGRTGWRVPKPTAPLFRNYSLYVCLLVASSILGVLVYDSYRLVNPYTLESSSALVELVRGPYTRPLVELVILLYYFCYYSVLPKYIFKSQEDLQYLFKWLVRTFYFMLWLGLLDVVSNALGGWYIPKHSAHSDLGYVGVRFHALLGEPRDAFPYVLFGLAVVYLRDTVTPGAKVPRALLPTCIVALVLTQSVSGFLGVAIGVAGILMYFSVKSLKRFVWAVVLVAATAPLVGLVISLSPHANAMASAFSGVWTILSSGEEFPYLIQVESPNVLPLWKMWLNVRELNLVPVLFGSGLGTTSIVNNNLTALFIKDTSSDLLNSNAQLTRVLFESGVVGFLIYLRIFTTPVGRFLVRYSRHRSANFVLFVLLLGTSLSHRGSAIFIYLGIIIALLTNWAPRTAKAGSPGLRPLRSAVPSRARETDRPAIVHGRAVRPTPPAGAAAPAPIPGRGPTSDTAPPCCG